MLPLCTHLVAAGGYEGGVKQVYIVSPGVCMREGAWGGWILM